MSATSDANDAQKEFLDAHNAARAVVGVAPLAWNWTLTMYAQEFANRVKQTCDNTEESSGPYGENTVSGYGAFTTTDAVSQWVEEKVNYDHHLNSRVNGTECKHYKQVVWRASVHLGCASVLCGAVALIFTLTLSFKPQPASCLSQDERTTFLSIHNDARAEVGVSPLSWDHKLESYAQAFANTAKPSCSPEGPRPKGGPYGESTASGYGAFGAWDTSMTWIGEKGYYDYASNSCVKGDCKHYTQMVWRNTKRIGCGIVSCGAGWPFVVCEYDPPGNIPGQRPY
ncbi:hypothetical protein Cgig2_019492 [Carnegiea gigantea]|uniref:SCP domain-containing protein n=1 Tax=Carnegiea gigantea TaxID=171969 RepID=A0A9Q1KRD7_9CARY|nr:hypothetical protein Cgig2_019492 [Carnegiea gigantea]